MLEVFLKDITSGTIYEIGPELKKSQQYRIWNNCRRALIETSLDGPVSPWFNSLPETDPQDWYSFYQSSWNNLIVSLSNLKIILTPKMFKYLLRNRFLFILAVLKIYSENVGLKLTQKNMNR